MSNDSSKTLAEWREHRGLSREELAERVGATAQMVERWEEIGLDVEPGSRHGDYLVGRIMAALRVDGELHLGHVPDSPNPGDLVISPGPGVNIEDLLERAEELNVRVAAPSKWGPMMKPIERLGTADYKAIAAEHRREAAYSARIAGLLDNTLEMLGGNSGEWKEGQTLGERLEEADEELGRDLDRRNEGGTV